ncbi:MAG: MBL fold metallo-hydrolase [Candidatus Thorarchaeota archaeon]
MEEIVPGYCVVRRDPVDDLGLISTYIVHDSDRALVVDPGTAGNPGPATVKSIQELGLDPSSDLVGIVCTHGHPDHIGGVGTLKKVTGAPVMIHADDARMLEVPRAFVDERLVLDKIGKLATMFEHGPLKVNYKGIRPDMLLTDGQSIQVGDIRLEVVHTGGHSAGHVVLFDRRRRVLLSGDEICNYPLDPRLFYLDLSGNLTMKLSALEMLSSLNPEHVLPFHDYPCSSERALRSICDMREGVLEFKDVVLQTLELRSEADLAQLCYDISDFFAHIVPRGPEALLSTTVFVALRSLETSGIVHRKANGIWKVVSPVQPR